MDNEMRLWLIILSTRDHAGDTAAIASVFSGRGIQIESFIGFGSAAQEQEKPRGRIMLTFYAFPERCRTLCRVLASLEAVEQVQYLAEQDIPPSLRHRSLEMRQELELLLGNQEPWH